MNPPAHSLLLEPCGRQVLASFHSLHLSCTLPAAGLCLAACSLAALLLLEVPSQCQPAIQSCWMQTEECLMAPVVYICHTMQASSAAGSAQARSFQWRPFVCQSPAALTPGLPPACRMSWFTSSPCSLHGQPSMPSVELAPQLWLGSSASQPRAGCHCLQLMPE